MKKAIQQMVSSEELLKVMLKKVLGESAILREKMAEEKSQGVYHTGHTLKMKIRESMLTKGDKIKAMLEELAKDVALDIEGQ